MLLDFGNTYMGFVLIYFASKIVPSISLTANLTTNPSAVGLVLVFSWLWVVLSTAIMILFANWKAINYEQFFTKVSHWSIWLVLVVIPMLIIFLMINEPRESGILGKFICSKLKKSIYFVVIYGGGLWLSISAGLFGIAFILNYWYQNFKRGMNH